MYVSDLDGTLLTTDGNLSERTSAVIARVLAEGVPFTVASARIVQSFQPLFAHLPLRLPVITLNGATVTDIGTARHEFMWPLDADVASDVMHRAWAGRLGPFVVSHDGRADRLHYDDASLNPAVSWHLDRRRAAGDPRLTHSPRLRLPRGEAVLSISAMSEDASAMAALAAALEEAHAGRIQLYPFENRYTRGHQWLTVAHPDATKGRAVEHLRAAYDLQTHPLTVFGDDHNDLPLFAVAHRAVAVENARPELKSRAAHVIGDHDDDSVAAFIAADLDRVQTTPAVRQEATHAGAEHPRAHSSVEAAGDGPPRQ